MEYHAIEDAEAWHKIQDVQEERINAGVEIKNDLIRTMGECRDVQRRIRIGVSMNVNMVFLPEQNRPDGSIRSD